MIHKLIVIILLVALFMTVHPAVPNAPPNRDVSDLVALIKAQSGLDVELENVG